MGGDYIGNGWGHVTALDQSGSIQQNAQCPTTFLSKKLHIFGLKLE